MRYALSLFALAATATAQQSLLETLSGQEDLSTLLQTAQSVPAFAAVLGLSNITILAPTNEAFAAVDQNSALGRAIAGNDTDYLAGVLAYHVIMGNYTASDVEETPQFVHTLLNDTYQFNGQPLANVTGGQNVELLKNGDEVTILSGSLAESNVTEADIFAQGATIHKINRVLSLPDTVSATGLSAGLNAAVAALVLTNLAQAVDAEGDITIFVPQNQAFRAIGSALIAASPEQLAEVLQYHVVNGTVLFSTQASNMTVPSMQGNNITINVANETVFVNNAKVVLPNVIVANGVVHVIDGVLNPNETAVNTSSLSPTETAAIAFPDATEADLPFTSNQPTATSTIVVPAIVTNAPAAGSSGSSNNQQSSSSSSSEAGAMPMMTAAANLLGAGVFMAGAFLV